MSTELKIQTPPDLGTHTLIKEFIKLKPGESYVFLADSGDGARLMQCVRSEISRLRNKMEKIGKKPRKFRLLSPIENYGQGENRKDLVTVTMVQSDASKVNELIEDMLVGEEL